MGVIKNTIKTVHPAYFAMVMSTGIISIASQLLGFTSIGYGLFCLNIVAYAVILSLQVLRIHMFWDNFYSDLSNPKLSLVFFTTVAATNVLGAQFITIVNQPEIAKGFWYFGIFLWTLVSLSAFSILFIKCDQRVEVVLHGGWLISAVGTQSVAVLGALLAPKFGSTSNFVMFSSFAWWMTGSFLYMILITLIIYRLVFFKVSPDALVPPYWINMGALAITTLAGSILCINIPKVGGPYNDFLGFTKGLTLFFWSFGTWWIPFLVIIGVWKYAINKTQFKYTPLYWGMVFPLGMYTVCTFRLSQAIQIPFLVNISKYFIYAAYIAWTFIFISMIRSMIKVAISKEIVSSNKIIKAPETTQREEGRIAPQSQTTTIIKR
ncbi:MAG: C4-dicarboxylate ABC transporter [wastewater metagenome]|nr:C4-dicarboxylate ABC transporter [Candidatus Loosdrechtia aerotolerans]